MSNSDRQYGWAKRCGLPVLYFDPMPMLGPYMNQRAMFKDGFPRPVRWWPTNWIVMPAVWLIELGALVVNIAKGRA